MGIDAPPQRPAIRPVLTRTLPVTLGLVLSGWAVSCSDGTTEPSLPTDPVDLDRAVLTILYEATGGADWTRSDNWLSAAVVGTWFGVTVGADGRVARLRLANNNLSGRIPPELGSLASLESLSLSLNDLSGRIPARTGQPVFPCGTLPPCQPTEWRSPAGIESALFP